MSQLSHNERLVVILKQHWIKYVGPLLIYLFLLSVSIACLVIAGIAVHHSTWISHGTFLLGLILITLLHHWMFLVLLSEQSTYIIVTNHRVILIRDKLLLEEQMMEYAFDKMKTVEARKEGFLQTILSYGSLRFESGSDITLVPHPNRVAKEIEQAMGLR